MKQRWQWQQYFLRKSQIPLTSPKTFMHFLEHHYIVLLCSSHFLLSVWLFNHKKKTNSWPQCSDTTTYPPETTDEKYTIKIRAEIIPKPAPNRRHVLNNACNGLISITNKPDFSLRCLLMPFHKVWFVLGRGPPTFLPLHNVQTLIRYLSITHLSFQEHLFSWVVRGSCIWFCDKH